MYISLFNEATPQPVAPGALKREAALEKATPAIKKYNGTILARGGKVETIEGQPSPRTVLIEFPTMEDALRCYNSVEYQEAKKIGKGEFNRHIQIVEGV